MIICEMDYILFEKEISKSVDIYPPLKFKKLHNKNFNTLYILIESEEGYLPLDIILGKYSIYFSQKQAAPQLKKFLTWELVLND